MARRKQEIALQVELETQEDWEDALSKEGLLVVDVYQEWAGPCTGMVANLRRLKNELGDDLLRFAVAKADTIDSLEHYRGKCEPCFMIYGSGTLVYHLAGAKAPVLIKAITEQLAMEHKVLNGDAERQAIRDPMMEEQTEKAQLDAEESEKEEIEVEQEVTVCLIKPDAVEAGKVDEILEQLTEHGMEILNQEVRQLTEEEAKSFYSAHEEEEYFEELIKFMCSGPSHVLVLSKGTSAGENTIAEFRDLLGPKMVEEAKEQAPESLRARYGTASMTNALHGSDSKENAMKELAFFFPDYVVPKQKITVTKPKIERTLALIRPDCLKEHKDDIIAKIKEAGFQIAFQKEIQLSKEQAENFYKEHQGEEYFEELTTRMSSGPILALALAREDAVAGWRDLLGPKEVPKAKEEAPQSLRAQFSVDEDVINPLHGSDSQSTAEEELNYFFPLQQTVAVVKPDAYQTKDEIVKRIHEAGFRIAARKETQLTKDIAEQLYEDNKDKEYFDELTDHLTSGNTLFLVLSREDAVDGWRSLIGPPDPEQAKEQAPGSIRAEFGVDVKQNAVHGSSNPEHAQKEMKLIFGDMEFNEDGTLKGEEPDLDAAVVEKGEDGEEPLDGAAMPEEEGEEKPEEEDEAKTDEQVAEGEAAPAAEGEAAATEEASPAEGEATTEAAPEQTEGGEAAPESAEAPAEPAAEGDAPAAETDEAAPAAAAESSDAPAESSEAPKEETEAPQESAEKPAETTDAPAETTDAPAETTDAPAESTDAPAEGTEAPAAEAAAESTETPAAPAEGTEGEQKPAEGEPEAKPE